MSDYWDEYPVRGVREMDGSMSLRPLTPMEVLTLRRLNDRYAGSVRSEYLASTDPRDEFLRALNRNMEQRTGDEPV